MSDKISVKIKREITCHIGEREVLLSFNNDEDAYHFQEWWDDEGEGSFQKWCGSDCGE